MKTYKHVEDYIEYLAGYEQVDKNSFIYDVVDIKDRSVQLSRKQFSFIDSIADGILYGHALTDRQANVACSIIIEHKRQFNKVGIDVSPVETPQYRRPLRIIKRAKEMNIVGEYIEIYFPFNEKLVSEIREFCKSTIGDYIYDYDRKISMFSINEHNVLWCYLWGVNNQFNIDPELEKLYNIVETCIDTPYEIKLIKTELGYNIENAEQSLLNYVNDKLGGFSEENLIELVDNSGILGYKIDSSIMQYIKHWKYLNFSLMQTRTLRPTTDNLIRTIEYAIDSNRFPIYLYQPAISASDIKVMDIAKQYFKDDEIINVEKYKSNRQFDTKCAKLIYMNTLYKGFDNNKIPLLVSFSKMLHGSNKQRWINSAEKIVYLSDTIGYQGPDGNSKNNYQGRS